MAKLYLRFEQSQSVLREVPLTQGTATIGRLPDNSVQIDNLAVSGHHAKIYWDDGHYVIEDVGSLNGTFVNEKRVGKATLIHGDQVKIGKHVLEFKNEGAIALGASVPKSGPATPQLDATVVLDTKQAREMIAEKGGPVSAARSVTGAPLPGRERIGVLRVLEGKTDQERYVLTAKMTMIGKSSLATIRLKGWFAPTTAALISKRENKYYIAPSEKKIKLKVNGEDSPNLKELHDGDLIEVSKFKATFSFQE
ncbi:MAG TPA: FHA domain-containing protein [Candidatus Angelobacter sp.]|nr:FHA domain-containing protein [Candidatus Angelobacter sp.]